MKLENITLEEKLKSNVNNMTEKKNQCLWEWDTDTTVQQKNSHSQLHISWIFHDIESTKDHVKKLAQT